MYEDCLSQDLYAETKQNCRASEITIFECEILMQKWAATSMRLLLQRFETNPRLLNMTN